MYLTPEDNYIMLRHTCSVPLYQMERDDAVDYRAMLARVNRPAFNTLTTLARYEIREGSYGALRARMGTLLAPVSTTRQQALKRLTFVKERK